MKYSTNMIILLSMFIGSFGYAKPTMNLKFCSKLDSYASGYLPVSGPYREHEIQIQTHKVTRLKIEDCCYRGPAKNGGDVRYAIVTSIFGTNGSTVVEGETDFFTVWVNTALKNQQTGQVVGVDSTSFQVTAYKKANGVFHGGEYSFRESSEFSIGGSTTLGFGRELCRRLKNNQLGYN